ncbi:hypothetical protein GLYMA_14G152350v4 [Glycine max]|nr:hypothetical protein GLYMA_14G152350v4 [Glycine max]KAH1094601.1 hypothetical protein GYH30_040056 [Glycine max]
MQSMQIKTCSIMLLAAASVVNRVSEVGINS